MHYTNVSLTHIPTAHILWYVLYLSLAGGMFNFVSGANYFGESVEWTGYALACWNVPASCFALFTVVNLGSRAIQYHW
jgi:phage-related protein